MKTVFRKLTLLLTFAAFSTAAFAQDYLEDPKWGNSPEERHKYALEYSFFRDYLNLKQYDNAIASLDMLIEAVPKATVGLYSEGANFYRALILRATSVEEKNQYIDKLFWIYDKRLENFGDAQRQGRPYILERYALEIASYRPQDREKLVGTLRDAIEANGNDVSGELINLYIKELTDDYKNDNIDADYYVAEYDRLEPLMKRESITDDERQIYEAFFISSGAANCETLEDMYGRKFAENPNDKEMLSKGVALMLRGGCKSDLFITMAEKYYEIEPMTITALILAAAYEEKQEYSRSIEFIKDILAKETDPEQRVNLYIRLASSEFGNKNVREAAGYARQAIDINPESGLAYYILGQAYGTGANNCTGFNRQSVYWLVYDTLARAKSLLANDPTNPISVSTLDSQMAQYRAGFPSKEECFFRGLNEGEGFNVSCGWISGRTTVREGR